MPPSSRKIRNTSLPTPIDPKMIRQHIRMFICYQASFHLRDTFSTDHIILNEIWHLVEYALLQLQIGEHTQAVTDICTAQGMQWNTNKQLRR